jgi:hypothetical protein
MSWKTRWWTLLSTFLVGGLLGAAFGAGAMLIAFPFLFPPAPGTDPAPFSIAADGVVGFEFDRAAPGRDMLHWANGTGSLIRTDQGWVLRLEPGFETGPGPDYWLYLNTRPVSDKADFEGDPHRQRLAKLRSFSGAQNYPLPADIDPTRYQSVTIWCETFRAYIGSGVLRQPVTGT